MCGIVGFTGFAKNNLLKEINASQVHRGPDEGGCYVNEEQNVHLAMRRLSIIDLTDGHQPMSNWDGSLWIVYNGEIFNAPVLRQFLEQKGYVFKTSHSDTEVLIYMYQHYGKKMVQYLNGMFAFSIYDKKENKIFCARD